MVENNYHPLDKGNGPYHFKQRPNDLKNFKGIDLNGEIEYLSSESDSDLRD